MSSLYGALLWSLFLFLTLHLHTKEEKKRINEYKGLYRLIQHMKNTLLQAPLTLSDIFARFSDDALAHAGFLSVLKESGLSTALKSKTLSLEEEDLLPFNDYAEELGKRLYSEEIAATDALLHAVASRLEQREATFPKRRRLTSTLFFSGGMLILLLLL